MAKNKQWDVEKAPLDMQVEYWKELAEINKEELHLAQVQLFDMHYYKYKLEHLEPAVKRFTRWFIALYILSFVYGVVAGALVF